MTWDQFVGAVPSPQFFFAIAIGFLGGYLTARLVDRIRIRIRTRSMPTDPPRDDNGGHRP